MAAGKLLLSCLLSSWLVTGAPNRVKKDHIQIFSRQLDTSGLPSQCNTQCGPLVAQINTCSPSGLVNDIDPTCFCTNNLSAEIDACAQCATQVDPSQATTAQSLGPVLLNFCQLGQSGTAGAPPPSTATGNPVSTFPDSSTSVENSVSGPSVTGVQPGGASVSGTSLSTTSALIPGSGASSPSTTIGSSTPATAAASGSGSGVDAPSSTAGAGDGSATGSSAAIKPTLGGPLVALFFSLSLLLYC